MRHSLTVMSKKSGLKMILNKNDAKADEKLSSLLQRHLSSIKSLKNEKPPIY